MMSSSIFCHQRARLGFHWLFPVFLKNMEKLETSSWLCHKTDKGQNFQQSIYQSRVGSCTTASADGGAVNTKRYPISWGPSSLRTWRSWVTPPPFSAALSLPRWGPRGRLCWSSGRTAAPGAATSSQWSRNAKPGPASLEPTSLPPGRKLGRS